MVAGDDEYGPYEAVIDAAPAHAAAQHLDDPELKRLLAGIPYAPMVVIALAYDRSQVGHPLDGFGMLNPSIERQRLLGSLWTSSIYRHRAPAGKVLLRCMAGGAQDPNAMRLTDEELAGLCRVELGPLYQLKGQPERVWIFRHERAIAQYVPGHLARLAALAEARRRLPGLHLTGSSYRGISVNHCLAAAEVTAATVLNELQEVQEVQEEQEERELHRVHQLGGRHELDETRKLDETHKLDEIDDHRKGHDEKTGKDYREAIG
jgi:oxygen-dependent protoporphyrinogen oxidase